MSLPNAAECRPGLLATSVCFNNALRGRPQGPPTPACIRLARRQHCCCVAAASCSPVWSAAHARQPELHHPPTLQALAVHAATRPPDRDNAQHHAGVCCLGRQARGEQPPTPAACHATTLGTAGPEARQGLASRPADWPPSCSARCMTPCPALICLVCLQKSCAIVSVLHQLDCILFRATGPARLHAVSCVQATPVLPMICDKPEMAQQAVGELPLMHRSAALTG